MASERSVLITFVAALLCVVIFVAPNAPGADGRFIIVGNISDPIDSWTQLWNYTNWTIENPLYVGDVAVFKYKFYYHVVWQLPDASDWEGCVYDNAAFIGNDTAGEGAGFWVPVTDHPTYLACGVFGHCEIGQKVVLNGSLGPLPPSMKNVDVPPPNPSPPPATPSTSPVLSPATSTASPPPVSTPPSSPSTGGSTATPSSPSPAPSTATPSSPSPAPSSAHALYFPISIYVLGLALLAAVASALDLSIV
eukprot:TRINITY_DN3371_c0_g2_i2.p1 TRINITY_DN3371_c0_g2~~TRINITY_DN3371_c0_g2_i2.p1  ORF type:complete len:262 (+),score=49.73 TRINITY_DN3371_c0_g2_i2:37-786(+)